MEQSRSLYKMAAVSAAMVKQLRDRTGQAMMDCKKALVEADGNMEKAVDVLRKKGMSVLEKRSTRETSEGRIVAKISPDGKRAVLVMLCSETDFTSNNEAFQRTAELVASGLLEASSVPDSAEEVSQLIVSEGRKLEDVINDLVGKTGERIRVGDFARFELDGSGLLYCYVHFNNKIGTLLQIETETAEAAGDGKVKILASDLAMHITATQPISVSRDDVDPELVSREKAIAADQVKDKPANIIDKIVVGKINKWFKERVLLEQPFVKDDKKSVGQLLEEAGTQVRSKLTLKRFSRLQIG